ncbi:dihydrofolate reductase family protein [Microbacterium sp. Leaf151]|uniref:dihydrofolate reductase family protein n=1 Tax=Microbacterium sp. Leaf151 TaxID=1736276 RepID=UPI0006F854BA|nr:dihydrofolate reductase family protein [Microbacterium sp. Leaf151]KQR26034.1 riboflavin biosynthesis protein RibD [Microbacterium sp. Leaf151]
MRELTYYVAASIDGFIAAPDGTFDAFLAEGDHMAAVVSDFADALPTHVLNALGIHPPRTRFDTVIQGWNSYSVALDAGITNPYSHLAEYVATHRTDEPSGVRYTSDALATVRALKAKPGLGIYLCGGGSLAGSLLPEIDRLIIKSNPVVLGGGIPLFGGVTGAATTFTPLSAATFASGVTITEYVRPTAATSAG